MSSSDDEALQLFREAEGRSVISVIVQGVASVASAVSVGSTRGVLAILSFLFAPFVIFYDVAVASAQAFLLDPLTGFDAPAIGEVPGIIQVGILESGQALLGEAGVAGLPIGIVVVLTGFLIIGLFLSLGPTSDIVPGIFVDNRVYRFFFTTPEEEEEGA